MTQIYYKPNAAFVGHATILFIEFIHAEQINTISFPK